MKRITAGLLYFLYKLENHYFFKVPIKRWLWFLILVPPIIAYVRRMSWWGAALLSLLGVLTRVGLEWAKRRGYLVFEPAPLPAGSGNHPPIAVDEQLPGWAYGPFGVGGKQKHVAGHEAKLSYVSTREHIVMARVQRTRFLLFTQSLQAEVGWWYVFFAPDRVTRVEVGHIWCGFKTRLGLAFHYCPEERSDGEETFYLGFDDLDTLQRAIDDLRLDMPAEAFVS